MIEDHRAKDVIDFLLSENYLVWSMADDDVPKFHTKNLTFLRPTFSYCVTTGIKEGASEPYEGTHMGLMHRTFEDKFKGVDCHRRMFHQDR